MISHDFFTVFVSPTLAGKTNRDRFLIPLALTNKEWYYYKCMVYFLGGGAYVYVPFRLDFRHFGLLKKLEIWLKPNLRQRWNRGSFIYKWVKVHIPRSRIIWGQIRWKLLIFVIWVSVEKLEVRLEPNLGQRCNRGSSGGSLIRSWSQRSCTYAKGHLKSR